MHGPLLFNIEEFQTDPMHFYYFFRASLKGNDKVCMQ